MDQAKGVMDYRLVERIKSFHAGCHEEGGQIISQFEFPSLRIRRFDSVGPYRVAVVRATSRPPATPIGLLGNLITELYNQPNQQDIKSGYFNKPIIISQGSKFERYF